MCGPLCQVVTSLYPFEAKGSIRVDLVPDLRVFTVPQGARIRTLAFPREAWGLKHLQQGKASWGLTLAQRSANS